MNNLVNPTALKVLNAMKKGLWLSHEIVLHPLDSCLGNLVASLLNVNVLQEHTLKVYLLLLFVLVVTLVVAQEIVQFPSVFVIPEVFSLSDLLGSV